MLELKHHLIDVSSISQPKLRAAFHNLSCEHHDAYNESNSYSLLHSTQSRLPHITIKFSLH